MATGSLPVAFGTILAGGILLDHGVKAAKAAFASAGTAAAGSTAGGPITTINDAKLGPTTNPVPGATPSRLDQGMDFNNASRVLAPFNGTIVVANTDDPGWSSHGATAGYVAIQSTNDPSKVFYAAENWIPTVHVGEVVAVGQQIAAAHPYGAWGNPPGSGEIGWADPSNPTSPLARATSNPVQMVLDFAKWLQSLGAGAPTKTSNAGYA